MESRSFFFFFRSSLVLVVLVVLVLVLVVAVGGGFGGGDDDTFLSSLVTMILSLEFSSEFYKNTSSSTSHACSLLPEKGTKRNNTPMAVFYCPDVET